MLAYEIDELIECTQNEAHFILRHFKTQNPFNGLSTLKLEPKQLSVLNEVVNKQIIFDSIPERQIGTSTILAAHALWLALFHTHQRIVIMNPNTARAGVMRHIVREAITNLPDFLKLDIITDHQQSLEFQNGSWIHFVNGDPAHLRGFKTTCLIADSFDDFRAGWQTELRRTISSQIADTVELLRV